MQGYSPHAELLYCLHDAETALREARINAEIMRQQTGFDWQPVCACLQDIDTLRTYLETLMHANLFNEIVLAYGTAFGGEEYFLCL